MSEISGLSITDLRSQQLGFLDYPSICAPIQDFITVEKDIVASTTPNSNDKVEEEGGTSYVAERMAELSLAVETDSNQQQQDDTVSSSLNGEPNLNTDSKVIDTETEAIASGEETTIENTDQVPTNEDIIDQNIEGAANIEIITTAATPVKNEIETDYDDDKQNVSVEVIALYEVRFG